MHGAGFQGRADIAKLLIDHGLDPSDMHKDGYTPMHRSCWGREQRHTDTVKVFLEAGVPWDQPTARKHTPLQLTQNEKTRMVLHEAQHVNTVRPGDPGYGVMDAREL